MATQPHGAPYPLGTDRVADGDNAIQALALWADQRAMVSNGAPVTTPLAVKFYASGMLFGSNGVGRYDWAPFKPVNPFAVFYSSNGAPNLYLWPDNGVSANGFTVNSVWLAGGPANVTVPLIMFLVLDRIA